VEIVFEKFCCPPDGYEEKHYRDESIGPYGIIGTRGPRSKGDIFYNHMPAAELRGKLGPEIFDSYFKFCVVRNPYDKVVSYFWHMLNDKESKRLGDAPFDLVRTKFREFLRAKNQMPLDRDVFTINGDVIVDDFIRYESLEPGVQSICDKLGVAYAMGSLGRYKSGIRVRNEPFADYYDATAKAVVGNQFRFEIDAFGYSF